MIVARRQPPAGLLVEPDGTGSSLLGFGVVYGAIAVILVVWGPVVWVNVALSAFALLCLVAAAGEAACALYSRASARAARLGAAAVIVGALSAAALGELVDQAWLLMPFAVAN